MPELQKKISYVRILEVWSQEIVENILFLREKDFHLDSAKTNKKRYKNSFENSFSIIAAEIKCHTIFDFTILL